jgi:hypothetical protein
MADDRSPNDDGWQQLTGAEGCHHLLTLFGGFHDSCLREMHLSTRHAVHEDLRMSVDPSLDMAATILFQRQFRNPSAIELRFAELISLHANATPENYDSIIADAGLTFSTGEFHFDADGIVEISARQLAWRDTSRWMGFTNRYGIPQASQ